MDVSTFANSITFRRYRPDSDLAHYARSSTAFARRGESLEMRNTRLPEGEQELRERLGGLLAIPRMSTFAIASIINVAVAAMPPGSIFLNVGVWHGFTLLAGMAGNADRASVGIDNFSQFGGPREAFHERFDLARGTNDAFYELDYADYFAGVHDGRSIGFYIYDGGHGFADQLNGLVLAEPFLVPGSLILVDDTNWPNPRRATLEFLRRHVGRYAVVADHVTSANRHPTFWNGVMLIRRALDEDHAFGERHRSV